MKKALKVKHGRTHDGKPLAVIDGLPGDMAELRPSELRALAAILLQAAGDCEARPVGQRTHQDQHTTYTVDA